LALKLGIHVSEDDNTAPSKKILIEGTTETGEPFRPSDWAERMSGGLSTFRNRRVMYSPLLQPTVKDGQKCVLMDPTLADKHPALYQSVMDFAHANRLRICKIDDRDDESI